MLTRRDPASFRTRPEGGFVAGDEWLYFCFDASLFGYAIWGRPTPTDIRALVRLLELELDRAPHLALVDLGELETVHAEAFAALAQYTEIHAEGLSRGVTRAAIVRPPGMNGAIVTGFFDMSSKPFPASFWGSTAEALADLGRADVDACRAALVSARTASSRVPAFLQSLRAHLAQATKSEGPDLEVVARKVGLTPRTLQRRLAEQSTSFATEVQNARLDAARRLLRETSLSVTEIAFELGFQSPQHFATLFRKRMGVTPSAFRESE